MSSTTLDSQASLSAVGFGNLVDLARLQVGTPSAEICDACNIVNMGSASLGPFATFGGLSCGSSETCAAVRTPLNRPAHPRQYFARSRFAVWQASQNFVMATTTG